MTACHSRFALVAALFLAACGGDVSTGGAGGSGGGASAASGDGAGATNGSTGPSGTSSTSAGGAGVECKGADDCYVINDCCTCDAAPKSATAGCAEACEQSACAARGYGTPPPPACIAGRCVLGFECDQSKATCKSLPPTCPEGSVPSVLEQCWGPCVPATECRRVTACDQCGTATCVEHPSNGGVLRQCVPQDVCEGAPDCSCLGPLACEEHDSCSVEGGTLICGCPDC